MKAKKITIAILGAMLLPVASCTDYDLDYTEKEIAYREQFRDLFGEIDPDHNWSMAKTAKVNINVPGAKGYTLRILTEVPTNRDAVLLYQAKMVSDNLSANVDLIRGKKDVYVELKNSLGITIVDGYYKMGNDGIVNVNKMGTRAFDAGNAPGCSIYQTIIKRKFQSWDDSKATPTPYNHEWGFVGYASATPSTNLLEVNSLDDWTCYNNTESDNQMSIVTCTDSKVTVNNVDYHISNALYYKKAGDDTWVAYNCTLPQGKNKLHLALAYYNGEGNWTRVELSAKVNDTWKTIKTDRFWVKDKVFGNGDNAQFNDATLEFDNFYDADTEFSIKVYPVNWLDNIYIGGIVLEYESGNQIELINNGVVKYIDVRGGNVKVDGHNELRQAPTPRYGWWGLSGPFNYRTFDVTKMVDGDNKSYVGDGNISTFYIIDGENGENVKIGSENIKYKDMFPLYGLYRSTEDNSWKGSPFREGDNHIDQYFRDGSFNNPTEKEMQPDAQILTLGPIEAENVHYDGSVSIKLVGIGTGWANDIGYFYYPKSAENEVYRMIKGEKVLDFNRVPKVIIRKNMQQALNGQKPTNTGSEEEFYSGQLWSDEFSRFVDGCAVLGMDNEEFTSLTQSGMFSRYTNANDKFELKAFVDGVKDAGNAEKVKDATYEAPIYKLVYYGWSGNNPTLPTGTPSYIWPKDYVIGFFGIRTGVEEACELARVYTSSAPVQRYYFNDLPRGSAFSYKGKNYIGLEDELDYDNNDILFEVQGVQSIDPDITPDDDIVETKNVQNWIVACEDLGGSFDYDFNDLVWAVSKEVNKKTIGGVVTEGTTDIYFTPLAAGGTLEAIVEYNKSMDLNDNNWIQLGEIHKLVSRNADADTSIPLNVDPANPNITTNNIGERINLSSTSLTAGDDISVESVLNRFRIKVKGKNGEYVVTPFTKTEHSNQNPASKTPQFILLPEGWSWPAENVCILNVYNGITDWVKDKDNVTWYRNWMNNRNGVNNFIYNPLEGNYNR